MPATCPRCLETPLDETVGDTGRAYGCPTCAGQAVGVAVVRAQAGPERFGRLWGALLQHAQPGDLPCPTCRRPMRAWQAPAALGGAEVDLCRSCHVFWFDPGERGGLAPADGARQAAPPPLRPEVAAEADAAVAREEARLQADLHRSATRMDRMEGRGQRLLDVGDVAAALLELTIGLVFD